MSTEYNPDQVDHLITLYHENLARLEQGVRPSEEGTGRFYCVECQRWLPEPKAIVNDAPLCSCGTKLSEIPW